MKALLEAPFVRQSESLSKHTTMKVGGPARFWIEPENEEDLGWALKRLESFKIPLYILGAGSNVVFSPLGFDGAVLHLGKGFNWMSAQGEFLHAGAAAYLPKLTKFALENRLGNFEWACGVPGSLGGSLWGNAGARGFNGESWESRDCAADFSECIAFDRSGKRLKLTKSDVRFAYRKSSLGDLIVTQATFHLKPLSPEQATRHKVEVRKLLEKRRQTQPANAASAGCIWKNPSISVGSAGALIEELGLKNLSVGAARVSEIHGNFVINTGGASAADILELVELVERRVREARGIELEREARFI